MAVNGYLVTIKQAIGGVPFENVLAIYDTANTVPETLVTAVQEAWVAEGSFGDVVQTTDVDYLGSNYRDLDGDHDGIDFGWMAGVTSGQVATETAPISISMLYSMRTEHAGKSGRGRLYVAGVTHGAFASMQLKWNLSGSPGTDIAVAADTFRDLIPGGVATASWAVYSRKLDQVNVVTTTQAQELFGDQRRRNARVPTT